MKEAPPKKPRRTYRQLLTYIKKLYKEAGLVHGDLSEYNVMMWRDKPVLFDVSQAVSLKHPMAESFLRRDLENLRQFFMRLDVDVASVEEMYRFVTGGKG